MKMMVEGMTCGHCIRTITKAIQVLDASARVTVNLAEKTVVIDGDINPAFAEAVIEAEGYAVTAVEATESADPHGSATREPPVCCGSCHA